MIVRALVPPRDHLCDGCGSRLAYWSMRPEAVADGFEALDAPHYLCTPCLHEIEEALLVGASARRGQ